MGPSNVTSLRGRLLLAIGALTAIAVHGRASAGTPDEGEPVCIPPEADGQCPSDAAALDQIEESEAPVNCSPHLAEPGATLVDGECCYQVRYDCFETVGCNIGGRPLIIEGRPLQGSARRIEGWHDARLGAPDLGPLSARERQLLALHWARIGAAEHASIAGFQRFAMDLMANGAPADLIASAQRAALDEIRHARLAFTLASAFAGAPIGPAPLGLPPAVPVHRSLAELAIATAQEGCTVETLSACLLAEMLDRATDPAVIVALRQMRRDEDRHAELAYRTLSWALSQDPTIAAAVSAALDGAIRDLGTEGFSDPSSLERYSLLRPAQAEACRRRAIRDVIEPCRAALLSRVGQPRN